MADTMSFPKTLDEFMEQYKIVDTEQVYTNGVELVPIFRIRQWEDAHKPKKGKWIPYSKVYECRYNCSLCGYDLMGIHESEAKFCPNCGADMREEKTDETN